MCGLSEGELTKRDDYLEVHHMNRAYRRGHEVDGDLKLLCSSCHRKLHSEDTKTFPEGKYDFQIDNVEQRITSTGDPSIVVSLVVYVNDKTFRVNEWFTSKTTFKLAPFFNSVGCKASNGSVEDFEKNIGKRGRAEFVIRRSGGREYNNVNRWFYKTYTDDDFYYDPFKEV